MMRFIRFFFATLLAVLISAAAVGASFVVRWALDLPDFRELDQLKLEGTTRVYASDNTLIGVLAPTVSGERFDRRPVRLNEISALMTATLIASEDRDFYKHYGFDPIDIARSLFQTFVRGNQQGASTITQQLIRSTLIKNLADDRSRVVERKFKELMLALQVERYFTKEEILADYLNVVFWGGNLRGIRAAAQAYFGKDPLELTLGESVYLTALLPSPNDFFAPKDAVLGFKRVRAGMKVRLERLVKDEWVTQKEADAAWREKVQPRGWKVTYDANGGLKTAQLLDPGVNKVKEIRTEFATHFMFEVRKLLKTLIPDSNVYSGGGLKVFTTLDTKAQRAGESAVTQARRPWPQANQIALAAVNPYSGEVVALVGGLDTSGKDEFNRASGAQMRRSPGSSVKPLLFATAIEAGSQQWDTFEDSPLRIRVAGTSCDGVYGLWCPQNFDGPAAATYKGVTLRYALDHSLNLPTIRVLTDKVGTTLFRDKLKKLGFNVPTELPLSSAIGGIDVNPLQMALAYASFVNGGYAIEPRYIKRIEDAEGRVIYPRTADDEPKKRRVWSPQTAYVALDMIRGVVDDPPPMNPAEGSYAKDARLGSRPVGGKTGTSSNVVDMWFVGTSPEITAAVWFGRDDNKSMGSRNYSGEWVPRVWRAFAQNALQGRPPRQFYDGKPPEHISYRDVQGVRMAYFTQQQRAESAPTPTFSQEGPEPTPSRRPVVDGPPESNEARIVLPVDMCIKNQALVNPWADETTRPDCVERRTVRVSDLRFYDPSYQPPVIEPEPVPPPSPPAGDGSNTIITPPSGP